MGGETDDITMRIHTLLGQCMKDREADKVMSALRSLMEDPEDGPELVREMQKWLASV